MNTPPFFADFDAFTHYMDTLGVFHINPSLKEIGIILERMQLTSPPFIVVQVLGTNGKGSTSSMLSALCQHHGLKTGLFTSPHFVSLRERILTDSRQFEKEDWLQSANAVMAHGGETLTYFELLTVMALHLFARKGIQVAILEAGLGGNWDSTTAVDADMHVYATIGLDHMDILGDSLEKIAADKAGAIRSCAPVITTQQESAALEPLQAAARRHQAPFELADSDFASLPPDFLPQELPLHGEFQEANIRLALTAFRHIPALVSHRFPGWKSFSPTPESLGEALKRAWIPGRFQQIPATLNTPPFILDGAHNPHGMAALGLSLAKKGIGPAAVIFTCLADKQPEHIIPHLRALATGPVYIPPLLGNSRNARPAELANLVGLQAEPATSFAEALRKAVRFRETRFPEAKGESTYPILVCGSLYLLAEFYKLYPKYLQSI